MTSTEQTFSPENADRVHRAIVKAVNMAFPDKSAPPHSLDVLGGLALAAAEIMAGHEKPEVRAALVMQFGEFIATHLAYDVEMQELRTPQQLN